MQTILVVDDEKVIRDGCCRLLGIEGYRVLTAENGRDALDLLSAEKIDLVLCDLVMPVMGAFEVLEKVNSDYPDLPLIIITGHGTVATAVDAMKLGACDFVTKPFRADHLVLIAKRALEKRDLERRARELQEAQRRNLYDLTMEKSRVRTIVNCMADGVLVTNRDLEIVLYNPALLRLLELSPPAINSPALLDVVNDEDLVQGLKSILRSGNGDTGLISREIRRGDRCLHAVSAPVPGLENEVLGTVTVFQDVTVFKQLDEMKSSFVQMVSHELRSPLASIEQLLKVVLDGLAGGLSEKQKDLLGLSQMKIESLLCLINDLLDVAKIESCHGFQQQVPLDLLEVLDRTISLMKPRAESQNIELRLETMGKIPPIVADPRNMEELFSNLLSNAINYSPDGGEVVVRVDSREGFLSVEVCDSGIGIDPEEIPKIFGKFYRVKHPGTRQITGTGLGLAIVKGIVESHRGAIEVDSRPGAGSTFRVLLPAIG